MLLVEVQIRKGGAPWSVSAQLYVTLLSERGIKKKKKTFVEIQRMDNEINRIWSDQIQFVLKKSSDQITESNSQV